MSVAFVLGNGKSRKKLDLNLVRECGPIYGCNALYREFVPDVLIATDKPIADEIQNSGYAKTNKFFTRRPLPDSGALKLPIMYKGMSSGPNALAQACLDGYTTLYMIGFDLGTTDGQFNNVYADTQFYKKITDPPTFAGNWMKQIKQIAEQYNTRNIIRVVGKESAQVTMFSDYKNITTLELEQFENRLNSRKGIL